MVKCLDWSSLLNITATHTHDLYLLVQGYVDLHYMQWLAWVFYPLALTILMPLFIALLFLISAIIVYLYRLRHNLFFALRHAAQSRDYWEGARHIIALLWDFHGKIWHGYEVIGLHNIPSTGPALLIYYHGALPIDLYYLIATCMFSKNRQLYTVGDKFLFKIPVVKLLMEAFHVLPGTVSKGVSLLKEGNLLAIAPGGTREAYFSDQYYKLVWGSRAGFAKIGVEANVPVIPLFTQNCREAYRALSLGNRSWLQRLYEKTRLPIVPIYGGFPVKMRTFIGKPIEFDPGVSPDQFKDKVQEELELLISRHQRIPGNIMRALCERFYTPDHCKES